MDENGFTISSGTKELFMDEDEVVSKTDGERTFELTDDGMYAKKTETVEVDIGGYILRETEIYDEREAQMIMVASKFKQFDGFHWDSTEYDDEDDESMDTNLTANSELETTSEAEL